MAYRSSTTNSGTTTSPVVAVPALVSVDDIVIITIGFDNVAASVDAADLPGGASGGFTELAQVHPTGDGHTSWIGWKRAVSTDVGSFTFGPIFGTSWAWICQAFAFSGRNTTNPPVISTTAISNANNTSPITATATGLTALAGDDLLFALVTDKRAVTSAAAAPPAGYTEAQDATYDYCHNAGDYLNNVVSGATGSVSSVITGPNSGWVAWLVRIPASPTAGYAVTGNFVTAYVGSVEVRTSQIISVLGSDTLTASVGAATLVVTFHNGFSLPAVGTYQTYALISPSEIATINTSAVFAATKPTGYDDWVQGANSFDVFGNGLLVGTGVVAVNTNNNIFVNANGSSMTVSVGTVGVSLPFEVTGLPMTASVGSISVGGGVSIDLQSLEMIASVGSVSVDIFSPNVTVDLNGLHMTVTTGHVYVTGWSIVSSAPVETWTEVSRHVA